VFACCRNANVRALTQASRAFLEHPPAGFAPVPLLLSPANEDPVDPCDVASAK
jgi:hypothetical protein